jgi:hypothetical protein
MTNTLAYSTELFIVKKYERWIAESTENELLKLSTKSSFYKNRVCSELLVPLFKIPNLVNPTKVCVHWRHLLAKMLAILLGDIVLLTCLGYLGRVTQIGSLLFESCHPRWPRQVSRTILPNNIANIFANKCHQCTETFIGLTRFGMSRVTVAGSFAINLCQWKYSLSFAWMVPKSEKLDTEWKNISVFARI